MFGNLFKRLAPGRAAGGMNRNRFMTISITDDERDKKTGLR